ncbi:hypothetical protein SAMN04489709_11224 [Paracidovorax citrulli]|nr:hypothetical protein SAMN04489709_11224 [Paracidovorax citrulli]
MVLSTTNKRSWRMSKSAIHRHSVSVSIAPVGIGGDMISIARARSDLLLDGLYVEVPVLGGSNCNGTVTGNPPASRTRLSRPKRS